MKPDIDKVFEKLIEEHGQITNVHGSHFTPEFIKGYDACMRDIGLIVKELESEHIPPAKSLQEIKESLPIKYDFHSWHDEAAELYASQFKTPPVLQFNNNGPLANPINAKYEVINQYELWKRLIDDYDTADRESYGYATIVNKLKSKYTIIPKQ